MAADNDAATEAQPETIPAFDVAAFATLTVGDTVEFDTRRDPMEVTAVNPVDTYDDPHVTVTTSRGADYLVRLQDDGVTAQNYKSRRYEDLATLATPATPEGVSVDADDETDDDALDGDALAFDGGVRCDDCGVFMSSERDDDDLPVAECGNCGREASTEDLLASGDVVRTEASD